LITLNASRLAADVVFESDSVERQNGFIREIRTRKKFFVKGNMMRLELSVEHDGKIPLQSFHFVTPEQILIFDASKGTVLHIVPEGRAYSSESWHPEHRLLADQKGPDVTETDEKKTIGRWPATLRRVKTPRCSAAVQQWATSEPDIIRDLEVFERLAAKSKALTTGISMGEPVLVLESTLTCPQDDPNKSARGASIYFQIDNVNLEAIDDPNLFALPAGFKEVTPDRLRKTLGLKQKKKH
jgi:hypothetical protein